MDPETIKWLLMNGGAFVLTLILLLFGLARLVPTYLASQTKAYEDSQATFVKILEGQRTDFRAELQEERKARSEEMLRITEAVNNLAARLDRFTK